MARMEDIYEQISFIQGLQIVSLILKLTGVIAWSWEIILIPSWIILVGGSLVKIINVCTFIWENRTYEKW